MLSPKRLKFRKQHKGRIHGNAKGGTELSFGSFGLKALSPDRITARQIEAARRAITRREPAVYGFVFSRMFPYLINLPKSVWVKVKVLSNTGAQGFTLVVLCSKLKALMRKQLVLLLLWVLPNCRSRPSLLNA